MGSALTPTGSTHKWRKIRAAILRRDNHTCHHCGQPATTVDHLVNRVDGGDDNPANLVAACVRCNSRKGGQTGAARRWGKKPKPKPFLATGGTPGRLSMADNLPYPRGYSVSNRQERKTR